MARPRVVRSAHARRDLDGIWRQLAFAAGPEVADRILARIVEAMYLAAERPSIYRRRHEYLGAPHRVNVFRYAVFFEPLDEDDGIFVWRILHGARDLPRLVRASAELGEEGGD